MPLVYRTLNLGLPDGKRRMLFSQEDEADEVSPGGVIAMRFTASQPFRAVGMLAAAYGPEGAGLTLRLVADGEKVAGEAAFSRVLDRTWLSLETGEQTAGSYRLEMRAVTGRAGWWGQRLAAIPPGDVPGPPPFAIREVPEIPDQAISVPAGFVADRIAVLGGLSSYDHGVGWWRDYEIQGDQSDRQFIGDAGGWLEINYESGTVDRVPLAFGWTLWWSTHLDSTAWGGPFPEPFGSNSAAAQARDMALRLHRSGLASAPYWWELRPRAERIRSINLVDAPNHQGFPVVAAISVSTSARSPNLRVLGGQPTKEDNQTITPADLSSDRWRQPLDALRRALYRDAAGVPERLPEPEAAEPSLRFSSGKTADLLSSVWQANVADLRAKVGSDGRFHTSTPGAPNYGGYQGIGTWRDRVGYFAGQIWARDLGRAAIELIGLGDFQRIEPSLQFAGDRLYDLPNGFPRYQRDGQPLPAHWTTVLGDPLYLDRDQAGDGNQENDAGGLLILAYWRAWLARGRDSTWLASHVGTVRDAASWFVEQLDQPERWRSREGLLYGEGEAANDGGFDVLSNTLAWRALETAATMVDQVGEPARAARYRSASASIRQAVNRLLVEPAPDGLAWTSVAWNWGYGHDALAPVFTAADVLDFDLTTLTPAERSLASSTYRRQVGRCPDLLCVRAVGYGQGFLLQAALLLDDLGTASHLLNQLGIHLYDPRLSPFLVPEGIAVEPGGKVWYRTGDLGNAVHQAEVLKAFTLIAGVEDGPSGRLRLLPRLPDDLGGFEAKGWPSRSGKIDLRIERGLAGPAIDVSLPATAAIRLGPLDSGVRVFVDGQETAGTDIVSGGRRWNWVTVAAGQHRIESRR